jgi:hypothetical protein
LLTVWGGNLMIDGIRIHGPDSNFLTPQDGALHLLFLRISRAKQPRKYEVSNAGIFALSGDEMKPLLRGDPANRVFAWAAGMRVNDALAPNPRSPPLDRPTRRSAWTELETEALALQVQALA